MKIYLSSTFTDLREHRAAVERTLRKMGHDVIGMEHYAAESSRPVHRCKSDVEAADVYVLMLAWRYGYVPRADNPFSRSMTEIEYRHALEKQRTVLVFLLDPDTPWPPSAMDSAGADPVASAAIGRLRSDVGSEHLAGIFTSPADLAGQVAAAVASQGLTKSLSETVLDQSAVNADQMGGFGEGGRLEDTSLHDIKTMISKAGTDRAIVVNLGEGVTWWSTRLFLLASLLNSLTPVRQIVFTGRGGRFVGMASPSAVLAGLASRFDRLDAFARRIGSGSSSEDRELEIDRQVNTWTTVFLPPGAAGAPVPAPPPNPDLGVGYPVPEDAVKVGVREELLQGWLGERLIDRCIQVRGPLSMSQVQQIVDCLVPDVPLEFHPTNDSTTVPGGAAGLSEVKLKVINRDKFALELAREWVRSGLPRNPAR